MKKNNVGSKILLDLLDANEESANTFLFLVLNVCGALFLITWFLTYFELNKSDILKETIAYFAVVIISAIIGFVLIQFHTTSAYTRYILEISLLVVSSVIYIFGTSDFWCLMLVPIATSVRYFDNRFSWKIGLLTWIAMLIATVIKFFMGYFEEHIDLAYVFIPDMTFISIKDSLAETLIEKGLVSPEKIYFREILITIGKTFMVFPMLLVCATIAKAGRRMIVESAQKVMTIDRVKAEVENAKVKIMLSQLQPHFLYNSLSAIMAIDDNPPETVEALADFSKYLRGNLNSLNADGPIPFSTELEHIERYVSLEKLRYGDRLEFEKDIETTDFNIPVLTTQMVVENAIKHGISQKSGNGTVTLKTREDERGYYITVTDNGVGFDVEQLKKMETHVGVLNSKSRIESIGGIFEIASEVGKGTTVRILIPREGDNYENNCS